MVYNHLKTLGFRKFGRTLHRFVEGDISQVIHFQNGCHTKGTYDVLWVNLGIRTRLGSLVDGKDTRYDLKKDPIKINWKRYSGTNQPIRSACLR